MPTLYQTIIKLCENRDISGGKMCNDLDLSRGLMTDLKMGRKSSVSAETAMKIANYFGVSVEYLFGSEKAKKPATCESDGRSETDKQIIQILSKLSENRKLMILAQLEGLMRMKE